MAKRGGFRPQAPKKVTLIIAIILWLVGLLTHFDVIRMPTNAGNLGFWSLVAAGLLLILGSLLDGV